MKLITAILREDAVDDVQIALAQQGISGMTVTAFWLKTVSPMRSPRMRDDMAAKMSINRASTSDIDLLWHPDKGDMHKDGSPY